VKDKEVNDLEIILSFERIPTSPEALDFTIRIHIKK